MNDILVSIICPAYNHEPYIRQCLEGFIMQKTNFRFEVLINDDASQDNTASIIREYENKYPEIIKPIFQTINQYSKKNYPFENILLPLASGKYVAICEGDDYWIDPLKLQKQVDFLEQNFDYSMCFHNALIVYEGDKMLPHIFNNLLLSKEVKLEELLNNWIVPTGSMIFRKSILPLPNWASLIYSSDLTLALLAYKHGRVYSLNSIMSVYRKSFDGTSLNSIMKDRSIFVNCQHKLLFELYNDFTNYKYDKILRKRITEVGIDIKYLKYKLRFRNFVCFIIPFTVLKKVYKKYTK